MATIKGKWLFNKEPILPETTIMEKVEYENLVFGSLLLKCHTLEITNTYIEYHVQEHIPPMSYGGNSHTAYDLNKGWYRLGHEIIDFGDDKEVSDTLFNWIIANAKPMTTISGLRVWNEEITPPNSAINEKVPFKAGILNGRMCGRIILNENNVIYRVKEGYEFPVIENGVWKHLNPNDVYISRMIDFGSTPRWVTQEFYDYIMANTQELSQEEWDSHFKTLSGKWFWNDKIEFPENSFACNIWCASIKDALVYENGILTIDSDQKQAFDPISSVVYYNAIEGWGESSDPKQWEDFSAYRVTDFGPSP